MNTPLIDPETEEDDDGNITQIGPDRGYTMSYSHVNDNVQPGDKWEAHQIEGINKNFGFGTLQVKAGDKRAWVCLHEDYLASSLGVHKQAMEAIPSFYFIDNTNVQFAISQYNQNPPAGAVWHYTGYAVEPGYQNLEIDTFAELDGLCVKSDGTTGVNQSEAAVAGDFGTFNIGTNDYWDYEPGYFIRGYLEADADGFKFVEDSSSDMFVAACMLPQSVSILKFHTIRIWPGVKQIIVPSKYVKRDGDIMSGPLAFNSPNSYIINTIDYAGSNSTDKKSYLNIALDKISGEMRASKYTWSSPSASTGKENQIQLEVLHCDDLNRN
jgi:hypothetical protein